MVTLSRKIYCLYPVILILCLSLLGCSTTTCQKIIPRNVSQKYFDESGAELSAKEFEKSINYAFNLPSYKLYGDTLIVSKLHFRERFGQLDSINFQKFKSDLEHSLSYKPNFDKDLCIGLFNDLPNAELCLDFYLSDQRYNKRMTKGLKNYIRVTESELDSTKTYFEHYIDKDKIISSTFFPEKIVCDYWLVIRPNGAYRTFLSEGGPSMFYELDKEWDEDYLEAYFKKLKSYK